ncbi:MAG: peroxiredoxin [Marinosulfonomonas sp.]|nr:peroxiredoxin [Marinosulfonomonas sp.]
MTISTGDQLPDATLMKIVDGAPVSVAMSDLLKGRRVVIFAVPGAFTRTCTAAHVPSFMRTADQFRAKGVDEIICLSVNDPFVMQAWGESTDGLKAGLTFMADADGSYTQALGLAFDAAPAGLFGRSRRYSMFIEDGVVSQYRPEENAGGCEISSGEALLELI